jgi:hypothetical protein
LSKAIARVESGHPSPDLTPQTHVFIFKPMGFRRPDTSTPDKVVAMRIALHYLIAVALLTIYGGQV